MHGFIENVVNQIITENLDISDYIFILPNKRAKIFLKREISNISNKTIFSPNIYEIDDFMSMISGIEKISNTELLFEFYRVYISKTNKKKQQKFDEFVSWGKTLLKDFNEIDKELCNTNSLFDYLENFKELNHWSNFEKETNLTKNYKEFWSKIKVFHNELIKSLYKNKKGYQGLIYRDAHKKIDNYKELKNIKHIFIGFNALSRSESEIIQKIICNNGEIYWDIDVSILNSNYNNATFFIESYIKKWSYYKNNKIKILSKEYKHKKNINVIGVPKNIGQIKYVGNILSRMNAQDLENTAIILADERMMIPMINSIPKNVKDLNITMGYPLNNSSIYSFFNILFKIHSKPKRVFYYKHILAVISHELITPILKKHIDIASEIKNQNLIYLDKKEIIEIDEPNKDVYKIIFSEWSDPAHAINSCIKLISIFKSYYSKESEFNSITIEFLYNINKVFLQIKLATEKFNFLKNINSLKIIFKELCEMNSTPFNGEPVKGLQIMGMLETRLLNYNNIIITSMNEGILPATFNNSFIPFEIKKSNNLQTYKEKDAVFSYHFYRIIQRAKNVWMTYNTEPDTINNGEISRFITQIEVEGIHKIKKNILVPKTPILKKNKEKYIKSSLVIQKINSSIKEGITTSMLSLYVYDKIRFFERYVLKIKEEKIEESMASNTLGNIIHESLERVYKKLEGKNLTIKGLDQIAVTIPKVVERIARKYVNEKNLKRGKNVIMIETAKKYVLRGIELDKKEITSGNSIKIIGVEKEFKIKINNENYTLKGKIDRVDEYNGIMRVIDYKTGKKLYKRDLEVKNCKELKDKKGIYNLQLIIYMLGLFEKTKRNKIKSGIISLKNMKDGVLEGKFEGEVLISRNKTGLFENIIIEIIEEILDQNKVFEN
tara:strand:+ start:680 stop:3352 length:2673 start_codon:yes stop_codon:yes gene_type:complete